MLSRAAVARRALARAASTSSSTSSRTPPPHPSPLANRPPPPHMLARHSPKPGGRFTLMKPAPLRIAGENTPQRRSERTPWRDSWRMLQHRLVRWREAKFVWRAQLRKEGKLKPRPPRIKGKDTPTLERTYGAWRKGRAYVKNKHGRAVRTQNRWLVFRDGTRARATGRRLPKKIFATVPLPTSKDDFKRAFPKGRLQVYDYALKLLEEDAAKLKDEAAQLRARVEVMPAGDEKQKALDKVNILDIQSEINLPRTRWEVKYGFYDFTRPVHRHLVEDKWRKEGRLDLLMERVYQMHIVPDLLPAFHPNVDMRVEYPMRPPYNKELAARVAESGGPRKAPMEPGRFLLPSQTLKQPTVRARAFHLDERLYTLVMVDPDVPDVANATFQAFAHWIVPNIPLSIHTRFALNLGSRHALKAQELPYVPPHPQQGSPYHRYTLFLLRQSVPLKIPGIAAMPRLGFDLRTFCARHGLLYPAAPTSPIEYPPLPPDVQPGHRAWVGRADPNEVEGGIPGGIRPGGTAGLPGPMGGRAARGGVPKGVRTGAGISGRSGGRGKEDEIGGGVFMFREEWDEEVSRIYREILKTPEPRYARPKKADPYEALRGIRKYY